MSKSVAIFASAKMRASFVHPLFAALENNKPGTLMLTQIVSIAVKLVAIIIFIIGIYLLADNYYFIHQFLENSKTIPSQYIALLSIPFIVSVFLWFFSHRVANIITPKQQKETAPLNQLSPDDIQSVVFSTIGLYFIVNALSKLIGWVFYVTKYNPEIHSQPEYFANTLVFAINMALGLYLLFFSNSLTRLLGKLKYAGTKK